MVPLQRGLRLGIAQSDSDPVGIILGQSEQHCSKQNTPVVVRSLAMRDSGKIG